MKWEINDAAYVCWNNGKPTSSRVLAVTDKNQPMVGRWESIWQEPGHMVTFARCGKFIRRWWGGWKLIHDEPRKEVK